MTTRRRHRAIAVPLGAALLVMIEGAGCADDAADSAMSSPAATPLDAVADTVAGSVDPTSSTSSTPSGSSAATTSTITAPAADPSVRLEPLGDFEQPVDLAWRAGDERLFVVERIGRVIAATDAGIGPVVLDMRELTVADGERGLLGLAFSADGALAYVNHTDTDGTTVIAEYAVDAEGMFDPTSRRVVLEIEQPYANHNGGSILVGPDAMLWIGTGDGGGGGDPDRLALDMSSLHGKILRIDPAPNGDAPYTIPPDNPVWDAPSARPEIWAVGVRNPWRMAFDRLTGDLWFGDVGQSTVEEIDVAWADEGRGRGANWGWSAMEGTRVLNTDQSAEGATPPVHEYEHTDGRCSVTGGDVYRGRSIPDLVGWYLFGDYCSGEITGLRLDDRAVERELPLASLPAVTALRSGPDGEMYALSLKGTVAELVRDR